MAKRKGDLGKSIEIWRVRDLYKYYFGNKDNINKILTQLQFEGWVVSGISYGRRWVALTKKAQNLISSVNFTSE